MLVEEDYNLHLSRENRMESRYLIGVDKDSDIDKIDEYIKEKQ